ncbi:hypothetical protein D9M71_641510 [compost metagenome]
MLMSWVAVRPSSSVCNGFDNASKAAMPLLHRVSPPYAGTCLAASTAPSAGVSRKVTSVCQMALSRTSVTAVSSTMTSRCSGTLG